MQDDRRQAHQGKNLHIADPIEIEKKLRDSEATDKKLTEQITELKDVVILLQEAQDFKDLDTANSSGSNHVSCVPHNLSEFLRPVPPRQPRF